MTYPTIFSLTSELKQRVERDLDSQAAHHLVVVAAYEECSRTSITGGLPHIMEHMLTDGLRTIAAKRVVEAAFESALLHGDILEFKILHGDEVMVEGYVLNHNRHPDGSASMRGDDKPEGFQYVTLDGLFESYVITWDLQQSIDAALEADAKHRRNFERAGELAEKRLREMLDMLAGIDSDDDDDDDDTENPWPFDEEVPF